MTASSADCQREPQVHCPCAKCHDYRMKHKVTPKTVSVKTIVEAVLALCDIDPYVKVVTFGDAVAYGWPQRYLGKKYSECLKDCTSKMLASVLHAHVPYLPVTFIQ